MTDIHIRLRLGLAVLICFLLVIPISLRAAGFNVCAKAGERLRLSVTFNATFENAVRITEIPTGTEVMSFDNYFGRGAGGEWRMGAGQWTTAKQEKNVCYRMEGFNKPGPPNPRLGWRGSALKQIGENVYGFDDQVDRDYNDAVVRITRIPDYADRRVSPKAERLSKRPAPRQPDAPKEIMRAPAPTAPSPAPSPAEAPPPPRSMEKAEPRLPYFSPWPPPAPSTKYTVPWDMAVGRRSASTWGEVSKRFEAALSAVGYLDLRYYAVPNGFALVTQVEQIESDGRYAPEPNRWVVRAEPMTVSTWTLEGALRRIAGAPVGFYRVIVFVFSSEVYGYGAETISEKQATQWKTGGLSGLPLDLRKLLYSDDFNCIALVYEFEQRAINQLPKLNDPGRLSGRTHLLQTNILAQLERLP